MQFFLLWRDCLTTTQQSMRHCITKVYIQKDCNSWRHPLELGLLVLLSLWHLRLSPWKIKLHCVLCDIPFSLCVCVWGGGGQTLCPLYFLLHCYVLVTWGNLHSHTISLSLMPLDLRLPDMRTKCVCVCVCVWCVCVCVCVCVSCVLLRMNAYGEGPGAPWRGEVFKTGATVTGALPFLNSPSAQHQRL